MSVALVSSQWWMALWWREPQDLMPWIELFSVYTPQIFVRSANSMLVEIGRSRSIVNKEYLEKKVQAMEGYALPQLGDAAHPAEALARAQFQEQDKGDFPLEVLQYFLEPFRELSVESLRPLKKFLLEVKALGITRLGFFLDLSEREVGMRWSHWGKRLWLGAHGYLPLVEPTLDMSETFEEIYEFPEEAPGTQLEPLYFISKQLLHSLHERLQKKNLGARSLLIVLAGSTYEDDFCGTIEFQLTLPAFHHEVSLWLNLLRERLQNLAQQQKLPENLESFLIRVSETLVWQGLQKDLFDPHRERREGALLESLGKLESRLGSTKMFCAEPVESYRPERSWARGSANEWYHRISREKRQETGHGNGISLNSNSTVRPLPAISKVYEILSQRPLRVYPSPLKVTLDARQILFNRKWFHYKLIWCELVCGEFWRDHFERRYGVAYLETGEKLWLFKEQDEIFLQGQFL